MLVCHLLYEFGKKWLNPRGIIIKDSRGTPKAPKSRAKRYTCKHIHNKVLASFRNGSLFLFPESVANVLCDCTLDQQPLSSTLNFVGLDLSTNVIIEREAIFSES